ncbi:Thioesterase PikA5 [Streptomyces sp. RB5]|uniref:Thioesterase PikA5 n=1 Tax=Streptomyces smaragdinus TaxID=2585196 RepID=A0A7K0CCV5_9ACTN|nr:alpha/beta fold hydrolase [Streptomyces smaragdinus]MQY11295.1 Thioesterase PikA5 [Streptomyces smaragdinus]
MPPAGPRGAPGGWTRCGEARPGAAVNLVCLPHAGGSAGFYRGWNELLPREVEFHPVQYPGHADRLVEEPVATMAEMADRVTEAIRPLFDRDVVLFGHSMGASVAFEVAKRCEARGLRPRLLVVSGRGAPHRQRPGHMHTRPDDELVDSILEFSPVSEAALREPELRELLLPVIRADYRLIETYLPADPGQIAAPVAVLRGRDDERAREVGAWSELTTGGCEHYEFDGGHFYLLDHEDAVVRTIAEVVAKTLR